MATWFDDWAGRHAQLFGLLQDGDLDTLMSWEPVFLAAGYTAAELDEATAYLASHPEALTGDLRFLGRGERHLAAIRRRITDRRAVYYRAQVQAQEQDRGTCNVCGGTGRVVVPHLAGVVDGEWREVRATRSLPSFYTMAVFCSCALGRWVRSKALSRVPEGKRFLDLDDYERQNPRWRVQMAARQRSLAADAEWQGRLSRGPAEDQFRRVRDQLAASWGMPGEDDEPF